MPRLSKGKVGAGLAGGLVTFVSKGKYYLLWLNSFICAGL